MKLGNKIDRKSDSVDNSEEYEGRKSFMKNLEPLISDLHQILLTISDLIQILVRIIINEKYDGKCKLG